MRSIFPDSLFVEKTKQVEEFVVQSIREALGLPEPEEKKQ
jgi:hypothetical protein